jgi:hypothetical protein
MDTLVLRPRPGPLRLGLNFAVGALAVGLLVMCAYGSDEAPSDTTVLTVGAGLFAFLAILTALAIRNYYAATLRLSGEWFAIGKHKVAWTDVGAFQRVPRFIRVCYVPGRAPGRGAAVTQKMGRIGLYFPPTYISAKYDTGGDGRDVYEILSQHAADPSDIATEAPRS